MATETTVIGTYLPNWFVKGEEFAAGDTVDLQWLLSEDGVDDDGLLRRRGTGPTVTGIVYAWDAVDGRFEDDAGMPMPSFTPSPTAFSGPLVLYVPQFQLDPTSDWLRPKPGRYTVSFVLASGRTVAWDDWQDIVVPAGSVTLTWMQISEYSKGGVSMFGYNETFSKEAILAMFASFTPAVSGLANQFFATPNGAPGSAALRAILPGDVPALATSKITSGVFDVARLASGSPLASTFVAGDGTWKTVASGIGYTPENLASRGAASGYASLDAGTKVPAAQLGGAGADATKVLVGDQAWKTVPTVLGYTPENLANKAAASGYASLDGTTHVPVAQIPDLTSTYLGLGVGGTLVARLLVDVSAAANFSAGESTAYHLSQVPPTRGAVAIKGSYALDSPAVFNIFELSAAITNSGTAPAVGVGGFGLATGPGGQAWGGNFAGYVDLSAGTTIATAHGAELDSFLVGSSPYQRGYVALLVAGGVNGVTPGTASDGSLGCNQAYIQMQVGNTQQAACRNGIVFNPSGFQPVLGTLGSGHGALIYAPTVVANYIINATSGGYAFGFDVALSTFTTAAMRISANQPGIVTLNDNNSLNLSLLRTNAGNQLLIGDSVYTGDAHDMDDIMFRAANNIGPAGAPIDLAKLWSGGFGAVHLNGWEPNNAAPVHTAGAFTGGGTGTPSITAVGLAGRDPGHKFTFTTTAAPAANAKIAAVAFAHPYDNAPVVIVRPVGPQAGSVAANGVHVENLTTAGYDLFSGATALTATTAYAFDLAVIGF